MKVLTPFFEDVIQASVTPASLTAQLRGVDLAVRVLGRTNRQGPVGVEAKIDTYNSGRMSIELISQDRGTYSRPKPAEGYIAKDSSLIAYYFVKSGTMVVLNMALAYPWLNAIRKQILQAPASLQLPQNSFLSATPNSGYLSYTWMVPVSHVLENCPGTIYLNVAELLGTGRHAQLTETALDFGSIPPASDTAGNLDILQSWLAQAECYDIKVPLNADEKERLLRALEPRARCKKDVRVEQAFRELKASRTPMALPEDKPLNVRAA